MPSYRKIVLDAAILMNAGIGVSLAAKQRLTEVAEKLVTNFVTENLALESNGTSSGFIRLENLDRVIQKNREARMDVLAVGISCFTLPVKACRRLLVEY